MKAVKSFKIGNLEIESKNDAIVWIKKTDQAVNNETNELIERCAQELEEYFDGKRTRFEFPISYEYGTPFQKDVWSALKEIPFGEVITYKELARRVRTENHSRAVANANGKNPISIVIPCHRVIESSGGIGGYSSGLDTKRFLLKIEGINLQN